MNNFSIFGISGEITLKESDTFTHVIDETERYISISNETYHHDEKGLVFDYKYVIEAEVYDDGNDNEVMYSINLVPTPESLCKSRYDKINDGNAFDIYDMFLYGMYVGLDFKEEMYDTHIKDCVIEEIANAVPTINGLLGFWLDKQANAMGTTGWDLLRDFVNGEDWNEATLSRIKI